jgi:acid stress chaperone HdeB
LEIVLTTAMLAAIAGLLLSLAAAGMLGKLVGALVAAVATLATPATPSAHAQVVDLSTIKCKDFIELPKDTVNAITMWLDGYYTDEEDPAVVDFDKLKAKGEKLATFCVQNPRMGLMTAAESVMSK